MFVVYDNRAFRYSDLREKISDGIQNGKRLETLLSMAKVCMHACIVL